MYVFYFVCLYCYLLLVSWPFIHLDVKQCTRTRLSMSIGIEYKLRVWCVAVCRNGALKGCTVFASCLWSQIQSPYGNEHNVPTRWIINDKYTAAGNSHLICSLAPSNASAWPNTNKTVNMRINLRVYFTNCFVTNDFVIWSSQTDSARR